MVDKEQVASRGDRVLEGVERLRGGAGTSLKKLTRAAFGLPDQTCSDWP
ncbi:hypothetical protein ACUY2E_00195 [Corynebacterium confusum]|nr:hypothetical protein [uncultured Corynebacterium sp.]